MDEADIAKALQTDLNFHKVRIQVKCLNNYLHVLATRSEEYEVNYDFLFLLVQSRLEQLRMKGISNFTLYGRKIGDKLPEWQKSESIHQFHTLNDNETLIVVDGKSDNTVINQPISRKPTRNYSLLLIVIAVVLMSGVTWFIVDRLEQWQRLAQAQMVESQTDINQLRQLEQLITDRHAINQAIALLQSIPNRPGSLYSQAQIEITKLQAKLAGLDPKIAMEEAAVAKLKSAKKLAQAASMMVQQPPHQVTVWRSALAKWLESLKLLETVPPNTFTYTEATQKLAAYQINYRDITLQLQNQLYVDARQYFLPNLISDGVVPEMMALKSNGITKTGFKDTCIPFVSNNLDPVEVQTQKVQLMPFAEYICDRLWVGK